MTEIQSDRSGIENDLSRLPVAHFAVFEQRWIDHLISTYLPDEEILRIICTREIAGRLYPGLPGKGLRAVAGYPGLSNAEGNVLDGRKKKSLYRLI